MSEATDEQKMHHYMAIEDIFWRTFMTPITTMAKLNRRQCECSSMVERQLPKFSTSV